MFNLKTKRLAGGAAIFALLLVFLIPAGASAGQRRGRGNDDRWEQGRRVNYKRKWNKQSWKKYRRFRNGHDGSDGRFDGRGRGRNNRFDARFDRRGRGRGRG
ncbi:MAG: hypothetical protein JO360_12365 [Acidobacteria bacterium]|nr:hypothetical protein [Acidobacteriota bacterium]